MISFKNIVTLLVLFGAWLALISVEPNIYSIVGFVLAGVGACIAAVVGGREDEGPTRLA